MLTKKNPLRITAISSATRTEAQIPVVPKRRGRSRTAPHSNTIVLKKEIIADVIPSFSAVKKPDEKVLNHIKRKTRENFVFPHA